MGQTIILIALFAAAGAIEDTNVLVLGMLFAGAVASGWSWFLLRVISQREG